MEVPPEVRYVVRNGRNIAFQQFGSGDHRLVQINALAGNLDLLWTDAVSSDLLVRNAELFEVVMYDQLGQGLSDPVDHVPTLEERVADLAAVMDAAGLESATISAIFDACLVVMVFAAQHPERVDGLALWNPFAQGWRAGPFEQLVGWKDAGQVEAYDRAWREAYKNWGRGATLRMQMPSLATRRNLVLWGLLERAAASPGMIQALHQATVTADVREALPLVQARALVVRYSGHTMPVGVMRHVAELLPNALLPRAPRDRQLGGVPRELYEAGRGVRFGHQPRGESQSCSRDGAVHQHRGFDRARRLTRRQSLA